MYADGFVLFPKYKPILTNLKLSISIASFLDSLSGMIVHRDDVPVVFAPADSALVARHSGLASVFGNGGTVRDLFELGVRVVVVNKPIKPMQIVSGRVPVPFGNIHDEIFGKLPVLFEIFLDEREPFRVEVEVDVRKVFCETDHMLEVRVRLDLSRTVVSQKFDVMFRQFFFDLPESAVEIVANDQRVISPRGNVDVVVTLCRPDGIAVALASIATAGAGANDVREVPLVLRGDRFVSWEQVKVVDLSDLPVPLRELDAHPIGVMKVIRCF